MNIYTDKENFHACRDSFLILFTYDTSFTPSPICLFLYFFLSLRMTQWRNAPKNSSERNAEDILYKNNIWELHIHIEERERERTKRMERMKGGLRRWCEFNGHKPWQQNEKRLCSRRERISSSFEEFFFFFWTFTWINARIQKAQKRATRCSRKGNVGREPTMPLIAVHLYYLRRVLQKVSVFVFTSVFPNCRLSFPVVRSATQRKHIKALYPVLPCSLVTSLCSADPSSSSL